MGMPLPFPCVAVGVGGGSGDWMAAICGDDKKWQRQELDGTGTEPMTTAIHKKRTLKGQYFGKAPVKFTYHMTNSRWI